MLNLLSKSLYWGIIWDEKDLYAYYYNKKCDTFGIIVETYLNIFYFSWYNTYISNYRGCDSMKKTKQYITNSTMLLILFFVLINQLQLISSLTINPEQSVYQDIWFYLVLIIGAYIAVNVLYYLPLLFIFKINFKIVVNKPILNIYKTQTKLIKIYLHTNKNYLIGSQVIRC